MPLDSPIDERFRALVESAPQEALRESEERFRSAFASADIGMALVGLDGQFLQVNDSLCELVGYSEEELLGKSFQDITHPDDLDADLEFVRRMLAGEIRTYKMEKRYFHRLGHPVWALLTVSFVRRPDGEPLYFISQIQNISPQKHSQEELQKAETRFRTLIEQLPLGTYIRPVDMSQPNIYASPQVEPMLGYPAEEWETDPELLARILHPEDRPRVLGAAAHVRATGEPSRQEYRLIARDGRVVWVQDETYIVHDEHGQPLVQGFLLDITERKRAEQERDRFRDELHHSQKLDALGRLAGGVAHDFNNMLTAIAGYSDLLLEGLPADSPLRNEAEQIRRAAEQAATLPRQLLAFSRKQVLEPTEVDLNQVVDETTDLLKRVIGETVRLSTFPRARPATAILDRGQMEQVLVNLAVNARDAMDGGSGSITIGTRNVKVSEELAREHETSPGPYVVLSVADTGPGIDPQTRAQIFEPFFTTKPAGEGSGLGLATVYGIVRQSGGFVTVDSEPGHGATFEVFLPAAPALHAAEPGSRTASASPSEATVLLAEDEELVRGLATTALERAGYRVLAAASGEEALALAERHGDSIDVFVTDMVMPGMNGHECAEQALVHVPGIPVVLMSGYTDERPVRLDDGAIGRFLQKPFSPKTLVEAVAEAVARAARNRELAGASDAVLDVTCVVADDHPAVLDSISRVLQRAGIDVVAVAGDGAHALEEIEAHRPAVALLDVRMPPLGGIEVTRRLAATAPETRVVLYSGHDGRDQVREALAAGARGFVLKGAPVSEVARALRAVAAGGTYIDPELAEALSPRAADPSSPLTPREREVLSLLAEGLTTEGVAGRLSISGETVQSHVGNAMVKLGADTRTHAVATAIRRSLIPMARALG